MAFKLFVEWSLAPDDDNAEIGSDDVAYYQVGLMTTRDQVTGIGDFYAWKNNVGTQYTTFKIDDEDADECFWPWVRSVSAEGEKSDWVPATDKHGIVDIVAARTDTRAEGFGSFTSHLPADARPGDKIIVGICSASPDAPSPDYTGPGWAPPVGFTAHEQNDVAVLIEDLDDPGDAYARAVDTQVHVYYGDVDKVGEGPFVFTPDDDDYARQVVAITLIARGGHECALFDEIFDPIDETLAGFWDVGTSVGSAATSGYLWDGTFSLVQEYNAREPRHGSHGGLVVVFRSMSQSGWGGLTSIVFDAAQEGYEGLGIGAFAFDGDGDGYVGQSIDDMYGYAAWTHLPRGGDSQFGAEETWGNSSPGKRAAVIGMEWLDDSAPTCDEGLPPGNLEGGSP